MELYLHGDFIAEDGWSIGLFNIKRKSAPRCLCRGAESEKVSDDFTFHLSKYHDLEVLFQLHFLLQASEAAF